MAMLTEKEEKAVLEALRQKRLQDLITPVDKSAYGVEDEPVNEEKSWLDKIGSGLGSAMKYLGSAKGGQYLAAMTKSPYTQTGISRQSMAREPLEAEQERADEEAKQARMLAYQQSIEAKKAQVDEYLEVQQDQSMEERKFTAGQQPKTLEQILANQVGKGELTIQEAMKIKSPPKADKPDEGAKQLPPNTILKLIEGKTIAQMLPDVEKAIKMFEGEWGPLSFIQENNPWNRAAKAFTAKMYVASQTFGKYMEGGVLRKEDEEKYKKMFPQLRDTDDTKRDKLAIIRRELNRKYEENRKALEASGYDVSGFEELEIPPSIFEEKGLTVGTVQDGYIYQGGDLSNPSSWRKQ